MDAEQIRHSRLSASQVKVLKTLASVGGEGLTRSEIESRSGVAAPTPVLGRSLPTYSMGVVVEEDTESDEGSLVDLGYVTRGQIDREGRDITLFSITSEGRRVASSVETSGRIPAQYRIPGEVLDPAVLRMMAKRTYGLEWYTDEDIKEILAECGAKWSGVPLDLVRRQIANRRKQGAFKAQFHYPEWYEEYRESEEFLTVEDECLTHWNGACVICSSDKEVQSYHRSGDLRFGCERPTDLIPLCKSCWESNRKRLPQIPESDPR